MKKSYLKRIFALAALLILPISALAQSTTLGGLPDFFTETQPGDLSINFLTQIFGHVPGVLYGMNFQLVAKLAEIFNAGLVSVMGALFAYTTLKITLHAAHEGEMMAGKGKTLGMAVIRSVAGLSLAIPAGSGYSAVQIVVLWLAVQGIGFANMAWTGVVNYLYEGGVLYEQYQNDADDARQMVPIGDQFGNLLQSEACVYKLQSLYGAQQSQEAQTNAELAASSSSDFTPTPTTSTSSASATFGYGLNRDGVSYNFGTVNKNYNKEDASTGNPYNAECGSFNMEKLIKGSSSGPSSAQSLIDYMAPAAKQLAAYDVSKSDPALVDYLAGVVAMATTNYTQLVAPARKGNGTSYTTKPKGLQEAFDRIRQSQAEAQAKIARDTLRMSLQDGWLTAGAYYFVMSKTSDLQRQELEKFKPTSVAHGFSKTGEFIYPGGGSQSYSSPAYDISGMSAVNKKSVWETLQMLQVSQPADEKGNKPEDFWLVAKGYTTYLTAFATQAAVNERYINTATSQNASGSAFDSRRFSSATHDWDFAGSTSRSNLQKGVDLVSGVSWTGGPIAGASMTILAHAMKDVAGQFRAAISPDALDPILKLQKFGISLQTSAMSFFLASFFVTFASVLATSVIPSVTVSTAMKASAELPSAVTTLWIGFCFTIGGALGYYLVLILFIVWFTAIISWFGHVFQAVFGSPLVALRMADPEGEGIIGKAGEGITMLFSLCLTPFLLVAGFVVALVVTKQALILFNYMFNIFMASTITTWEANPQTWLLIGMPAVITIYTTIVISMVQLISTACLTEGMGSVKAFFTASAVGQRISGEMHQEAKGAASQQASGQGQSVGGGVTGSQKGSSFDKGVSDELWKKGEDKKTGISNRQD